MGNVCGTDMYSEVMKKYGPEFTKLVLAEKSKEALTQKVDQSKTEATSMFSQFESKANQQIDAQTVQLKSALENAKSELNSKVPGGIASLQKLQGKSADELLGFSDIMKKVDSIKAETKQSIDKQKTEAFSSLEKAKTEAQANIDKQKPAVPLFDSLPAPIQKQLMARGTEEFKSQIEKNNTSVLGSLAPMLGLDKYKSMLDGINPANKMNELMSFASGGLKDKISSLTSLSGGLGGMAGKFGF